MLSNQMDCMEPESVGRVFVQYLSGIEELAEEILTDKQQMRDLDNKRNTNREALSALKKCKDVNKSWLCSGGMFIKYPTQDICELLKTDQENVESEIKRLRNDMKQKVAKLHELEGKQPPRGFDLSAMDKDDLSVIVEK